MEKKLNVKMPNIRVYPHHANVMAMLGDNTYELPLLYNYYVPIMYNLTENRLDFAIGYDIVPFWANNEIMVSNKISRSMIANNWGSFHEFIISAINDNSYVYGLVDKFYIKAYKNEYNQQHSTHDIMIYGYDTDKKIVYVADCFVNGVYSFDVATFEEIDSSFVSDIENDWIKGVWLLKKDMAPYIGIGYDIDKLRNDIERYLQGSLVETVNIKQNYRMYSELFNNDLNVACGIKIYSYIVEYMLYQVRNKDEIDIRIIYMLYEHKNYLASLCKKLHTVGKFDDTYNAYGVLLKNKSKIKSLSSLVVKYNMTRMEKNIISVIEGLVDIERSEKGRFHSLQMAIHDTGKRENTRRGDKILSTDVKLDYYGEWKHNAINGEDIAFMVNEESECRYMFWGNDIRINVENINFEAVKTYIDGEDVVFKRGINREGRNELIYDNLETGYHVLGIKGGQAQINSFVSNNTMDILSKEFVQYIGVDEKTKGNWKDKYGTEGYYLIGEENKIPYYMVEASVQFFNSVCLIMRRDCNDERCLLPISGNGERIQAIQISHDYIDLDIIIPGKKCRAISIYMADYEYFGRAAEVEVYNGDTGDIMYKNVIEDYTKGIYVKYLIKGHILFRIKNVSQPDVVISGVFID